MMKNITIGGWIRTIVEPNFIREQTQSDVRTVRAIGEELTFLANVHKKGL